MKFLRFTPKERYEELIGVLSKDEKEVFDLNFFELGKKYSSMQEIIENFNEVELKIVRNLLSGNLNGQGKYKLEEVKILSPLKKTIHDIICSGFNYADHLKEIKKDSSNKVMNSVYFSKRATKLLGLDDEIDGHLELDPALDYEVELAVIIGKTGKKIKKEDVENYIFGYTIINDVSARTLQGKHRQWYIGKSLDTFTCLGPVIVTKDELPMPLNLEIKSILNGEVRQHSNTNLMIRGVAELINEISQGITLEPGDIIATGTCSGVGVGFDPPKYMKSGDIIECQIEKIGTLRNKIK
ncbi:MAG: fumarylacetoacetate hydrolase family protein [Fusobacterium perfoetens]|uniref:fumarylacetoacetate hydrolase family protein n=1 Tax=Fusobacterium perfoetens TaxID=852 RepID=UPI0023F31081|nr:fumarylacetoacetate hydrolase family protein [Fusobacterium perfoetens]MCI6151820.1 fumarylacetoacetate hydrolase family protein [Fusobacterium perfoetens]MDY3236819.1 fumarylacetoacetate hydrolase family protein [Fusobacterium perfoetens]